MGPDRITGDDTAARRWPPQPLPPANIVGERFALRPWAAPDADALAAAWRDEEIRRWTAPPGADRAAAARWIAGEDARRARGLALDLVIDVEGEVVGEVGCSQFDQRPATCAIGYWIGAAHRGNGLATRAVTALLDWAHGELGLRAALATTHETNRASVRTLERAGFALLAPQPGGRVVYSWSRP